MGSSELTKEAVLTIGIFAGRVQTQMKEKTNYCITVVGHTDKTGTDEINKALSQKRAEAVRDTLVDSKIPTGNIKASGVGSTACKKTGNQPECRKVEIEFTSSACSA